MWQYKPLYLVLLLLVVDKIFLLPAFVDNYTEYVDRELDLSVVKGIEAVRQERRPTAWAFGTSRSMPFRVRQNIEIDANGGQLQIIAVASYGYVPSTNFTQYLALRDAGLRPDAVFIELSPFAFNGSYELGKTLNYQGIPAKFFLKHMLKRSPQYIYQFLLEKSIASRRRHFVWEPNFAFRFVRMMHPIWTHEVDLTPIPGRRGKRLGGLPSDSIRSLEPQARLDIQGMMSDYSIDPVAEGEMKAFMRELKHDGVPFVLWRPAVHALYAEYYRTLHVEQPFTELVERLVEGSSVPYVDFYSSGVPGCDRYIDPAHVSDDCYGIIGEILWQSLPARKAEGLRR